MDVFADGCMPRVPTSLAHASEAEVLQRAVPAQLSPNSISTRRC